MSVIGGDQQANEDTKTRVRGISVFDEDNIANESAEAVRGKIVTVFGSNYSIKGFLKFILPPFLFIIMVKGFTKARNRFSPVVKKGVPAPWSRGYGEYKMRMIGRSLSDRGLLEKFRTGEVLPAGYGYGIDERIIEYPWLFANLPEEACNILDAGSILNHEGIIEQRYLSDKKLHILTLAPETACFWQKGISYLYEDLRDIPTRDDFYDLIVCLSTIEHIGCDNSIFVKDSADSKIALADFVKVMQELRRVLKPGGSLFLSVPFGRYEYLGMFQQFDQLLLSRAVSSFGQADMARQDFYKYSASGWQIAKADDCSDCQFVKWIVEAWQRGSVPFFVPIEPDLAAAARAVACLHLVKKM
jgi:SAM-dependent methyltransferase